MTADEEKAQRLEREQNRRFYEYLLYGLSEEQAAQVKADAIRLHSIGYSWEEAGLEAIDLIAKQKNLSNITASNTLQTRQGLDALQYMAGQGIPLIGAYQSGAMIAEQKTENFTADTSELASLAAGKGDRQGRAKGTPISRFYFLPKDAGLLCLDIDRKPGKSDGLQELYKLFPPDTLPEELRDIERYFPCYVSTPSSGYHLYFKYNGELIRKTNLAPEVEIKHGRPGLTAPGSRKENGAYILHGEIKDAPPLSWFIFERITELQKQKQNKPQRIAADKSTRLTSSKYRNAWESKQRTTLDALANETTAAYSGHHDRQVSFAGKAYRCKFTLADTAAYVAANPDVFGNGSDTYGTIESVFRDNGGI